MDADSKKIIRETLAHLVPCSGGKPVVLARPNLFLGRRENVDASTPLTQQTARCRLRLINGWWEIDRVDPTIELRINHRTCESGRVRPGDELTIGRSRYRLEYQSPERPSDMAMSVLNVTMPATPKPCCASVTETPVANARPTPEPPRSQQPGQPPRPSRAPLLTPKRTVEMPVQPPQRGLLAHLVPVGGGQDFAILKPVVTVGREKDCDISLRVKTVSSLHCKLCLEDGYWKVVDLNSRNGVRVDGVSCKEAWVFPESRLSISDQRFQLDYQPVGPRPFQSLDDPSNRKSLMDKIGLKERELDKILARVEEKYEDDTPSKRRDLTIDM